MNELRLMDPFELAPHHVAWRSLLRPWKSPALDVAQRIKIDIGEQDGSYTVKADLPGVKKEDIDICVDGRQVTISAAVKKEKEEKRNGRVLRSERQTGYASRSFTLACPVDEDKARAHYESGVLQLTLPKMATAWTKRLSVN